VVRPSFPDTGAQHEPYAPPQPDADGQALKQPDKRAFNDADKGSDGETVEIAHRDTQHSTLQEPKRGSHAPSVNRANHEAYSIPDHGTKPASVKGGNACLLVESVSVVTHKLAHQVPSERPTRRPSVDPTLRPTVTPSFDPTRLPTLVSGRRNKVVSLTRWMLIRGVVLGRAGSERSTDHGSECDPNRQPDAGSQRTTHAVPHNGTYK
jgi:hypothetical protein